MAERREKVILELVDNFSTEMARAAAATALLNRELNSLSGKSVETSRDNDRLQRSISNVGTEATRTGAALERGGRDIDKYSGRLGLLVDAAASLGPVVIPLGAAAIPAITGIAAGLGAAAGAVGVTVLAFQGMGTAIDAVNKYQIQPTAENLAKMRQALADVGPAGADFVRFISTLEPALHALQNTARENLFPGLEEGIKNLLPLLPQVQRIVGNLAAEMGSLAAQAGEALSGPKFSAFFDYLEADGTRILHHFAEATGNVIEGLANLVVAFGPLSRDFSAGLEDMTQSFADWTAHLSQTQGFQDFVDYIRTSGPQALDLLGSLGQALLGIVQAAAPWGDVVLPALTALADVLASIANSPIGTPLFTAAAGFVALSRAASVAGPAISSLSDAFLDLRTSPNIAATAMQRFGGAVKVAAGGLGIGLFVSSLHETNRSLSAFEGAAGGALAGFSVGGPWGAAIGGAIGLVTSLGTAHESTAGEVDDLAAAFDRQTGAITENVRAQAVQKLQQDGLLDAAQKLGISTQLVTDAVLGNAGAQQQLNRALSGYSFDRTITSVDDLRKSFSESEVQTILMDRAATKLKDGIPGLTTLFGQAGEKARQFASAMGGTGPAAQRAAEQLQRAREAARQTADSFITLGDSLNDSKVSLGDWIKQLQQQADALRDFAKNAQDAARRGLSEGLIQELQKAGPEGALRMKQLADGTQESIDRANRAWSSGQKAIREYTNTIGGVKTPTLEVNDAQMRAKLNAAVNALRAYGLTKAQASLLLNDLASGRVKNAQDLVNKYGMTNATATALLNDLASGKINAVRSALQSLDGQRAVTTIETVHVESYQVKRSQGASGPVANADGGTIMGQRHPYGDKVLSWLAPGEEVISNRYGQADRFRADRAAGRIPQYADGGTVARYSQRPMSTAARASSYGPSTVRHVIDVRVTGDMDLTRAKAKLRQVVATATRGEVDAARRFDDEVLTRD